MDRNVAPGESFYRFANGNWDRTTEIPADRANYGMFTALDDLSRQRTRAILDEAMRRPGLADRRFLRELHGRGRGRRRRHHAAAADAGADPGDRRPLRFRRRGGPAVPPGRHRAVQRLYRQRRPACPNETIQRLLQSGLGLPDRDYYLRDDATLNEKRTAYQAYLAQLLTLAGEDNAAARAAAVLAFERRIAEVHWTRVESRDDERTYNKWARADFARNAPGFDWDRYFRETGLAAQPNILVSQPSAFTGTALIVSETPVPVLKDYLLLRLVDTAAPYLSRPFVEAQFAFRGTVLNGTPQNEPRWKRGVTLVTGAIPDEISRIYVEPPFPARGQARRGRAGPQPHLGDGPAAAGAELDGAGDACRRARQARRLHPQDRLSRPLARLFERGDQPHQPPAEHRQRQRVRISAQPRTSSAGRSTAANG